MDPSKQLLPYSQPFLQRDHLQEVLDLMVDGRLDRGPVEQRFREAIARRLEVPTSWVCLTNSCTAALEAIGWALDGTDYVNAPVLTWPSTYSWAWDRMLWDVTEEGLIDLTKVRGRVRTLIPVELWGRRLTAEDLIRLRPVANTIILDAAQNLFDPNHKVWLTKGLVDAVCYSFGPIKQMTTGHGGAVIAPEAHDMLAAYCDSGTVGRGKIQPEGKNFEMSEIAAAIGLKQLEMFDGFQKHRWDLLRIYGSLYPGMITLPGTHSGHLAVASFPSSGVRKRVADELFKIGVQTTFHYSLPLWLDPEDYPVAKQLSETVLTIPCHVNVRFDKAREIAARMAAIVGESGK